MTVEHCCEKKNTYLYSIIIFSDVNNFDSYDTFAETVKSIVGETGLNVLINNAGIMKAKKDSLSEYTAKDMMDTVTTNYIAPVLLIKVCNSNISFFRGFLFFNCDPLLLIVSIILIPRHCGHS